jgi:hypothetical protein
MSLYTKRELTDANQAINSLFNKCVKANTKLKINSSQQILLKRRIEALQISIELIEKEIKQF